MGHVLEHEICRAVKCLLMALEVQSFP
jgi:hypothetical protein